MKKLLVFLFLLPGLGLLGQVEAGMYSFSFSTYDPCMTYYSSGYGVVDLPSPNLLGFSINRMKSEEGKALYNFTVGMSVSGQHFVSDNFSTGLNFGFFLYKETSGSKNSTVLYSGGPELRFYIPFGPKWCGRLKLLGNYGWINEKQEGQWDEEPITCAIARMGVGYMYFPCECISIDLGVGYQYSKNRYAETFITNNSFVGEFGFSLYFK